MAFNTEHQERYLPRVRSLPPVSNNTRDGGEQHEKVQLVMCSWSQT